MAYDEIVASRVRSMLANLDGYSEREMFGGICFMINGNMCCGVVGEDLMLRLGAELATEALDEPHTRPMDFTGRPMKSMIYLEREGFAAERDLKTWIERAVEAVRSLPAK